jgi:hypothetical protein
MPGERATPQVATAAEDGTEDRDDGYGTSEERTDLLTVTKGGWAMTSGTGEDEQQAADSMSGTLDRWKARIDELKVQADLAKLDVRDEAQKKVEIAQNVCLAAYSKLRDAGHDATKSADSVRESMELLVHDIKEAFDAAEAVIRRG